MNNLDAKAGTIFNIQRPSFRIGTTQIKHEDPSQKFTNKRNGLGNHDITRRNFDASEIRPRIIDFEKLQAIDLETQGVKIQLGERTIEELFKTKVGDTTDTKWIEEKDRLTADYKARGMSTQEIERELEVNKPLGREQRKVTSSQNIGQSNLSVADKIQEIKQEVVDGRAESRLQQATLTGQLTLIFANTQVIENFTKLQLIDLSRTVARLNIPRNYQQMGFPRFVDVAYYTANQGVINLFIFSNVADDKNLDLDKPVYNFAGAGKQTTGLPSVKLTTMISALGRQGNDRRYLDLGRRGLISKAQLISVVKVLAKEWDNPDVSVDPANR